MPANAIDDDVVLPRIPGELLEMPGLCYRDPSLDFVAYVSGSLTNVVLHAGLQK